MKLLLLLLGGAHQQIVEHMVIPAGHKAPLHSIRALFSAYIGGSGLVQRLLTMNFKLVKYWF